VFAYLVSEVGETRGDPVQSRNGVVDRASKEGPLKIPMKFDEAMKLALNVKPPQEGWKEYERQLRKRRAKRGAKAAKMP